MMMLTAMAIMAQTPAWQADIWVDDFTDESREQVCAELSNADTLCIEFKDRHANAIYILNPASNELFSAGRLFDFRIDDQDPHRIDHSVRLINSALPGTIPVRWAPTVIIVRFNGMQGDEQWGANEQGTATSIWKGEELRVRVYVGTATRTRDSRVSLSGYRAAIREAFPDIAEEFARNTGVE